MDSLESADGEPLDETRLKKIILNFEKKSTKNQVNLTGILFINFLMFMAVRDRQTNLEYNLAWTITFFVEYFNQPNERGEILQTKFAHF